MTRCIQKIILSFIAVISLMGCLPERNYISNKKKGYTLLEVDRPKHFRITIRDNETGAVYTNLSVSKHCSEWRNAQVGRTYYFFEYLYEIPKKKRFEVEVKVKGFCDDLKRTAAFSRAFQR